MISLEFLLTLLGMTLMTYLCRIGGFLLLRQRPLSPRVQHLMNTAPGCVLLAVLAPHFGSDRPAELLALAATRWNMLTTVTLAVASAALLQRLF